MIPACMMPNWQKQVVHVIGTFFSPLPAACGEKWKMFPQVEVWRLDSRVTRVISNRIFPPVKCWMPRVTTGTVTVTISNLQNTRFHRYSPVLEFKAIASFRHISVDCPLFMGIGVTITNLQNACLLFLQLIWGGFGFRMTDTQGFLSSAFKIPLWSACVRLEMT